MKLSTLPKRNKSNRTVATPAFLADEIQDYLLTHPGIKPDDRLTSRNKGYLSREMDRGCKLSGVKRIRIHDLRHSHVSLLIEMGFSALASADQLGHETTEVTMVYAPLFPNKQDEMADRLDIERGPLGPFELDEVKPLKEVAK